MRAHLVHIITTLWLSFRLADATDGPLLELSPVPRHLWDVGLATRAEDAAVGLTDHEKFIWSSKENLDEEATVVSMVVWSKQDESVLDMEKFIYALEDVTCNDGSMDLKFKHPLLYLAARTAWEWVNFNDQRSFVMSPSWKGCGGKSREPWVVSNVQFNDKTQEATLDAVRSTWKDVSNTFTIDFGDFVPGGNSKRWFDTSLEKAFTIDLESSFPTDLWSISVQDPDIKLTATTKCNDCGTFGTLTFAGHIEVGLGGVNKLELTAEPDGIGLNLTLVHEFEAELGITWEPDPKKLATVTPPGWSIPGIIAFGPQVDFLAGMSFGKFSGKLSAEYGMSAIIPDSSIAKVDLAGDGEALEVSGWIPELDFQSPTISAEVDTEFQAFFEIFVALGLSVLDDTEIKAGLSLKLPQAELKVVLGSDEDGFCEGSDAEEGFKLTPSLSANLGLQGYYQLNEGDDRDVFLDIPLATGTFYTTDFCWDL